MVLPFLFPLWLILGTAGLEQAKNLAAESPLPDSNPFNDAESAENRASLSRQFAAAVNRRFEFQKRSQLFLRTHDVTLSVATMCVWKSRSFARWNQSLRRSPNSKPALLRWSAIISQYFTRSGWPQNRF
jgi:hypothetical protein